MPDSKAISVRIPSQLLDCLDAIAEKDYRAKSDGKPNRSQVMLDALEAYIEQRDYQNVDNTVSKEELEDALDSERKDIEQIMYIEIRKAIKPALDKIYRRLEALESAEKQPREAEQRSHIWGFLNSVSPANQASAEYKMVFNSILKWGESCPEEI